MKSFSDEVPSGRKKAMIIGFEMTRSTQGCRPTLSTTPLRPDFVVGPRIGLGRAPARKQGASAEKTEQHLLRTLNSRVRLRTIGLSEPQTRQGCRATGSRGRPPYDSSLYWE